jgi:hypothetical protein
MGWLTGRDSGTKGRNAPARGRVAKCGPHDRALPCWACNAAGKQAKASGTGPTPCPKHPGRMLRGGASRCSHPDC